MQTIRKLGWAVAAVAVLMLVTAACGGGGQGRTLYLFKADTADRSNCHGACASAWPPYLSSGAPQAGAGVTGGQLGTIPADGGAQVTYHGHPLYYYAGDSQPGDTAGQGLDQFGAKWYVVAPDGVGITG